MKRKWWFGLLPVICVIGLNAQGKYLTNDGFISFYSHTPIEDITADNEEVSAVLDAETGEIVVIAKMTAFQFEKKLMQQHFNENYVESHKYPKATFQGRILENEQLDYTTPGENRVTVKGEMTIHGVTREVESEGTLKVRKDAVSAETRFMLNPEDYDIKIPRVVRKNIAEQMEITVRLTLPPI